MNVIEQSTETNLGRRDVFDKLFELITRHDESYEKTFPLENFYDYVSTLEKALQDANEEEYRNKTDLNEFIDEVLLKFITVFKLREFRDEKIFYTFKQLLKLLTYIVKNSSRVNNFHKIYKYIYSLLPSLEKVPTSWEDIDLAYNKRSIVESIDEFITSIPEDFDRIKQLRIIKNNLEFSDIIWTPRRNRLGEIHKVNGDYVSIKDGYYTEIKLTLDDKLNSKLFSPVWAICSSLEQIAGNTIEINEIRKGSLSVDITVWSDDLVTHEQNKAYLTNTAKKLIKGAEDIKQEETSSIVVADAEAAVNELKEIGNSGKRIDSLQNFPAKPNKKSKKVKETEEKIKEAELQIRLLELEKLKNEVAKGRLDLVKELSDFTAKNLLETDDVLVSLNQVYTILKIGSDIKIVGDEDQAFG